MKSKEAKNAKSAVITSSPFPNNYAQEFLTFDRGHGVYLADVSGKKYLDFGAGIAVNALGYGRKDLARIAARQMRKIVHISNLYTTEPAIRLGTMMTATTPCASKPFSAVHFGNSGTEANEAAIKYARLYAYETRGPGHAKILSFDNAFHGRTLGALAVTPNPAYKTKFEPLMPGVAHAPFNDIETLEKTLSSEFAAVIVEVVQGEGGLSVMTREFADALSTLCEKHDVVLIADEIQTGIGRTGTLYASEMVSLRPDIVTLSKPLGGGLPLSATLIPEKINTLLKPGDHGTTFGGGPVTTAVSARVWEVITNPAFLERVRATADHLDTRLREISAAHRCVAGLRGAGLLRGIELAYPSDTASEAVGTVMSRARSHGLLVLRSGKNIVRIAPPLVITAAEIDAGIAILDSILGGLDEGAVER